MSFDGALSAPRVRRLQSRTSQTPLATPHSPQLFLNSVLAGYFLETETIWTLLERSLEDFLPVFFSLSATSSEGTTRSLDCLPSDDSNPEQPRYSLTFSNGARSCLTRRA